MTRLPERNLDVLRAVAVLLVLADHLLTIWDIYPQAISRWEIGRMGVLLFFVHTSLVLMGSLEREGDGGGVRGWVPAFYLRRAFRIYPLAIAAVCLALILGNPANVGSRLFLGHAPAPGAGTVLANLTLTQNLIGKPYLLSVLWTLPIEVQMYLLLPLFFLIARRGPGSVCAALAATAGAGLLVRFSGFRGMWHLGMVTFAPCFVAGVLAYALLRARVRPRLPGWVWPGVLAACVPLFLAFAPSPLTPERGWLFCLGVGCAIPQVANLGESRFTRAAKVICTYSYGIYLLHEPVLWLSFTVLHGILPVPLQWLVCAALLVLLPAVAYRMVERPGIQLGKRLASRERRVDVHLPLGPDEHPASSHGGNREAGREAGPVAA